MHNFSEDTLVEQTAMHLLGQLGWRTVNAMDEGVGPESLLGRDSRRGVILERELMEALRNLNPALPEAALRQALEVLTLERFTITPIRANRELYELLKGGVTVTFEGADGEQVTERVQVIDWETAANNRFLAVQQLWVTSPDGLYLRRPDVVGFVNGLPLVLIELKAAHKNLVDGYTDNLRDYRDTLPQLFIPNAFIIVSNGLDARVGSMTAGWEHFVDWQKVEREDEPKRPGLETMLKGMCQPQRLLDLVENFILYSEGDGQTLKILAKNHQYLGVNNALLALQEAKANRGKLGVFWHTQGSGKSFSMVFFAQKVLRRVPGNWSFVVVTDRDELDSQIYTTFARTGAVSEPEDQVRADSGVGLKALLQEDHRYLFTLIQKFRTDKDRVTGETELYPTLTTRDDVIVMTDEAHRSQYDVFAGNMRLALPNASFIGFTGTPLMAGEEKTREVFGDYVSVYNFRDAVEDHATVPLYYENRTPELELANEDFQADMEGLLDAASVDEEGETSLARAFGRQYQLITRDSRLEELARDIVAHFMGRLQFGKAMVVSIDKLTAVRMYGKVQAHWKGEIVRLEAELAHATGDARDALLARLTFMRQTDMAVVVSQAQNEIADFADKGVDIKPHRKRLVEEDLETKFKAPKDKLRIVFVCAMWMTGFDAPSVSTIYLDKPMRNHTLMQTIARANRVWEHKVSGLIVDYIGVFRDLQRALAIYGGGSGASDSPVRPKAELLAHLQAQVTSMRAFLTPRGIDPDALLGAHGFDRLQLLGDARDALLASEEIRKRYLDTASVIDRLYKAALPDALAQTFTLERALYVVLAEMLLVVTGGPVAPEQGVMGQVEELLDESVIAQRYRVREDGPKLDLSRIDFDRLAGAFQASPHKRTEAEKLKAMLTGRVDQLTRLNKTRVNFGEKLRAMIEEYNGSAANIEAFFQELLQFGQELDAEGQRAAREGLSEAELAIFDLVAQGDPDLSKREEKAVKAMAKQLLEKLKSSALVIDWRKKQQTKARVRKAIRDELRALGAAPGELDTLLKTIYAHVYESYADRGANVYA
ncbi:type I restriction endonuclease subunit R [Deinococcus arenicola]|uniref:Type I restriction enzyme endonuclease subunit n=1 Tax=Deinococcus arenicola TaxID=2994950 RepID=A0ABU4DLT6_9DEIO|nr:type I restriction endonuclease subunit R [Deinococcus sp. ZS9-10]MDV6373398.1 type I restriction endonuclease subunit R [Deinococcus sp. ZS9-10]